MRGARNAVLVLWLSLSIVFFMACSGEPTSPTRQEQVAQRGANVMPFNLEQTTHVFTPLSDGGIQRVVADDPADEEQIALVRSHLRKEAQAFARGDFSDPERIHGHLMPGLEILRVSYKEVDVAYSDVPTGGRIRYRSSDSSVVTALHRWFEAQLMDHGGHAERDR